MSKLTKIIRSSAAIISLALITGCAGIGQELKITKSVSTTPEPGEVESMEKIAIMVISPSYAGSQLGTKHLQNQLHRRGYSYTFSYLDELQFNKPDQVAKKAISDQDALLVVTNGYANGYVSTGAHCHSTGSATTHSNTTRANATTQCQATGYSYSNDDFNVALIKGNRTLFQGSYSTKLTNDGGAVSVVQSLAQYDPTETIVKHVLADMERNGVIEGVRQ